MIKNPLTEKFLAVGIILLFIGVAISQGTPRIKDQKSKNYFELTTEISGLPNMQSNKIFLTETKLNELRDILEDVEHKLNKASNSQESKDIFKDAVDRLYAFGLFGSINKQQAKKLLTGEYQQYNNGILLNKLLNRFLNNGDTPTDIEYLNKNSLVFYHLNTSKDHVFTVIIPFWIEILMRISLSFVVLAILKNFFGIFSFMGFVGIIGENFNIKTYGSYGFQEIDIDDYYDIRLEYFTGLRIQYDMDPPPHGTSDYQEGFLLGYARSVTTEINIDSSNN